MTVVNLIEKQIADYIEKQRPPIDIRHEIDIGYSFKDQTLEIFEIRPQFNDASKFIRTPVAKAVYVKSKGIWKIYWMRGNLKWYFYEPNPEVKDIHSVLAIIEKDEYGCFWG